MKKINNKGFTLLELIIAMSILTSVMFIGYNIFNKNSTLMHTQININKGQSNMNAINEYLTKDLEQTTSIELKIDGVVVADTKVNVEQKSTDKVLENAKQEIEDRLSKNNNFNYEYKLRLNDENKFSVYKVNIENKNKSIRYTLSLTDKNGVKVDFVNKELLKEGEVPFYIIGDDPYKVIMGYSDKKNNFNLHEFEVASRIKQDLVAESGTPELPTEPDTPKPPISPPTENNPSDQLKGDIVFEFTKKDKVYMTSEIKVGDNPQKNPADTQNSSYNFTTIIKTDDQSRISRENFKDVQDSCDPNFKNIRGIELELQGNITVPQFKIDNIMSEEISLPSNYSNKFYFPESGQYGVRFNSVSFANLQNDETGRIIINLIY